MCDAANTCTQSTRDFGYLSFDLHFLTSSSQWACVQYRGYSNSTDFSVQDSDVGAAYGYNLKYYEQSPTGDKVYPTAVPYPYTPYATKPQGHGYSTPPHHHKTKSAG